MDRMVGLIIDRMGASSIEYSLVASLIAIALVASMQAVGDTLVASYSDVVAAISQQ